VDVIIPRIAASLTKYGSFHSAAVLKCKACLRQTSSIALVRRARNKTALAPQLLARAGVGITKNSICPARPADLDDIVETGRRGAINYLKWPAAHTATEWY